MSPTVKTTLWIAGGLTAGVLIIIGIKKMMAKSAPVAPKKATPTVASVSPTQITLASLNSPAVSNSSNLPSRP